MSTSTSTTAQPEAYWTAADVARFLTVSAKWVYKHAALGHLPTTRLHGCVRFKPADIRAYAERCSRGAQPAGKVLPFNPGT